MIQFKTIIKHINVLNVLLLSLVVFFLIYSILPSISLDVRYVLPKPKKVEEVKKESSIQDQSPSSADYIIIAEENLFHPERQIPVEKQEGQPLPEPEFVLYGTLITDDIRIAYLEDLKAPVNTPGRGKRQTPLRIGDSMSGFTLKDIEAEKIVMVRGEEKMVVLLNDPVREKERPTVTPAAQKESTRQQPSPESRKAPLSIKERVKSQQKTVTPQQKILQPPTQRKEASRKAFMDAFKGGRNK